MSRGRYLARTSKNEAMFEVLDKKVRSSPRSPVARLVMVVEESGRGG